MTGEESKTSGQEQVLSSNGAWKDQIYGVLRGTSGDFTSEDIRAKAKELGIAEPKHSNAWGAVINAASKRGIITRTGERCRSKLPRSHAASLDVWRTCEGLVEPAMSLAL